MKTLKNKVSITLDADVIEKIKELAENDCIFQQNSISVPEGRHAIPLQTARWQLMV